MCVNELRDGVRRKGRAARKGKNSFRSNDSERLYQLVRGIDCNTHTHTGKQTTANGNLSLKMFAKGLK